MPSPAATPTAYSVAAGSTGARTALKLSPTTDYSPTGSDAGINEALEKTSTLTLGDGAPRKSRVLTLEQLDAIVEAKAKSSAPLYSALPFIRASTSDDADPFASSSSPVSQRFRSTHSTPKGGFKGKGRAEKDGDWRSRSSRSASGSASFEGTSTSPSVARVQRSGKHAKRREMDDVYNDIANDDAQSYYPPSSCVFVANLLASESDQSLLAAVTQMFRKYGTVFVKLRRDSNQMPFAFCQFTNDVAASMAIKYGRGRLIKGRPCRCEKAKAYRFFFFERKYGPTVTTEEAEALLTPFGDLTVNRPATHMEMAQNRLSEGVMVQFALYDGGQNALRVFRNNNHAEYQLTDMNALNSPLRRENPADRRYLETYEQDTRSIHVGGLPSDATERDVEQMFERWGPIVGVKLLHTQSAVEANSSYTFAFVEYTQALNALQAMKAMNGAFVGGKPLKVTQKNSEKKIQAAIQHDTRPAAPQYPEVHQSPVPAPIPAPVPAVQHGASPMTSPGQYTPSPYSYAGPYGANYGYPGGYDASQWSPWAYSGYPPYPSYYGYGGSPGPSQSSPVAVQGYSGYPGFQANGPPPAWNLTQHPVYLPHPPPYYPQPVENTTTDEEELTDEEPSDPAIPGEAAVVDSSMETH